MRALSNAESIILKVVNEILHFDKLPTYQKQLEILSLKDGKSFDERKFKLLEEFLEVTEAASPVEILEELIDFIMVAATIDKNLLRRLQKHMMNADYELTLGLHIKDLIPSLMLALVPGNIHIPSIQILTIMVKTSTRKFKVLNFSKDYIRSVIEKKLEKYRTKYT